MKTYQDLAKLTTEQDRIEFIRSAINEHKNSGQYKVAFDAEQYDRQNNVTIMQYRKVLYTLSGKAVPDLYSPDYKQPSNFFNLLTTQENQYLLGNGVHLLKDDNKERLGPDFDFKLQQMGRNALVEGISFGYWNFNKLETFKLTEFVPLWDEEDGALRAGIRYYQVDDDKPLRATLYETDGVTDYIQRKNKTMEVLNEKRGYIQLQITSEADGTEIRDGGNYPGFPIIPMYGNMHRQSELIGLRESIDAYDLMNSEFSNEMDSARIYWALKNSGGMDDVDLAKFLERLNILHVAQVEDGDDITPHNVPINHEAWQVYLDRLEQNIYRDYQALNVTDISSGNKTATEIRAAYQPFDNKVDNYEYCVLDFLDGLFKIVGIEGEEPSFTRNKVACENEDMQTLLLAANYLDDEYITKKACAILGDPDSAQDVINNRAESDMNRLMSTETKQAEQAEAQEEMEG